MSEPVVNPFAIAARDNSAVAANAAALSDQQRQISEVQAAMMLARTNPRDQVLAMDRILNACARVSLAEKATYAYARGGTSVTGASIRLAEAIAQQWGNIQFGIRELAQRNGESTVQAFAWDVETNTRREVTFQVLHVRDTKKGKTMLTDSRDIYEMVANQGARRLRACILAIIPSDVVEAAVTQCQNTLLAKCDVSKESIKKMVDAFEAFNVSQSQIEKFLQRRVDAIQPQQMVNLKNIYASLRDGMSTPETWFDPEKPAAVISVATTDATGIIAPPPQPARSKLGMLLDAVPEGEPTHAAA